MRYLLKKVFFIYQKLMWYVGQSNAEIRKPLIFLNEILLIITFLAVKGYKIEILSVILLYILILGLAVLIGKFLTWVGVVAYNARLVNKQNPELLEILEKLKEIENIINKNKYG